MAGKLLAVSRGRNIIRQGLSWAPFSAVFTGLVLGLLSVSVPATAHVTAGGLRHDIVVEERLAGTTIWVRVPLPVLFGDEIAEAARTGAPLSTDSLNLERTGTGLRYRVDVTRFAPGNPDMTARLGDALYVTRDSKRVQPVVTRWRLFARPPKIPFDRPDAALSALNGPSTRLDPVFGQATVVYEIEIPSGAGPLRLMTGPTPLSLPASVDFDTRISRYTYGEQRWNYARAGQLDSAVTLPVAAWPGIIRHVASVAMPLVILVLCLLGIWVVRIHRSAPIYSD